MDSRTTHSTDSAYSNIPHTYSDPHRPPDQPWSCPALSLTILTLVGIHFCRKVFPRLDFLFLSIFETLRNCLVYLMHSIWLHTRGLRPGAALAPLPDGSSNEGASRSVVHKSQVLRQVLGLAQRPLHPARPKGLGNWDNSCYQNSVIQALASFSSIREFLGQIDDYTGDLSETSTVGSLREIIAALNDTSTPGGYYWTPSRLKSMSSLQQQDAQEYFSRLVDEVEKDFVSQIWPSKLGKADEGLASLTTHVESSQQSDAQVDGQEDGTLLAGATLADLFSKTQSPRSQNSKLRNPLDGLLAQRVGCTQCNYSEGLSLIPFNCLTLPLGRKYISHISECLTEYTDLEYIEGVECAKCTLLSARTKLTQFLQESHQQLAEEHDPAERLEIEAFAAVNIRPHLKAVDQALREEDFADATLSQKCQLPSRYRSSCTKTRQAVVARAPKCLVLHINRSLFDEMTGEQFKNYADVRYPKVFDLGRWAVGSSGSKPKVRRDERVDGPEVNMGDDREHGDGLSHEPSDPVEQWNMNPTVPMNTASHDPSNPEYLYDLKAVITHYGRHEKGHYICYRELPPSGPTSAKPLSSPFGGKDGNNDDDGDETTSTISSGADTPDASSDEDEGAKWFRISDDDVTPVNEDIALSQGGAFMLFYERREWRPSEHPRAGEGNRAEEKDVVEGVEVGSEVSEVTVEGDQEVEKEETALDSVPVDDRYEVATPRSSPLTPSTTEAATSSSLADLSASEDAPPRDFTPPSPQISRSESDDTAPAATPETTSEDTSPTLTPLDSPHHQTSPQKRIHMRAAAPSYTPSYEVTSSSDDGSELEGRENELRRMRLVAT